MQRKKIVIVAIFAVMAVVAVVGFFALEYAKSHSYTKLWPQDGDVIATVDGKEYRYDPVYLYRLTGSVFPDDPTTSNMEDNLPGYPVSSSNMGLFLGDNWGEAAVCLELLYNEGKKYYEGSRVRTNLLQENYAEWYSYLSHIKNTDIWGPEDDIVMAAYEKAKFKENQSDEDYLQDLGPYMTKLAYIEEGILHYDHMAFDKLIETYNITPEEPNEEGVPVETYTRICSALGNDLMAKYNVKMAE